MSTTNARKRKRKQSHTMAPHAGTNGEIDARHLLAVGVSAPDVAAITGLGLSQVKRMAQHSAGPYDPQEAAALLGVSDRSIYRAIDEIRGASSEITRAMLAHIAESRLREDGDRKARFLLFLGKSPRLAAIRGRISEAKAEAILKELVKVEAGPNTEGPYTVDQASHVLGLADRQVRAYCQHGRLGARFGKTYMISRESLLEFGARDRRPGWPTGVKQAS